MQEAFNIVNLLTLQTIRIMNEPHLKSARLLAARLERLSADTLWAHRASGIRGSLLRAIEKIEQGYESDEDITRFEDTLIEGFDILEKAAMELL
jgi:hypothetical protein